MKKYAFQKKYSVVSIAIFGIIFILFLTSIFKNISYPLFWADESMTVVGAERVIEFGYPKVHDGKNVFYDLRHSDPELGIEKNSDAYIGGTSWLQYYFGVLGIKMASGEDDLYKKTGTIRTTFAIIGLVGLLFLAFAISTLFSTKFEKYLFAAIFFLYELFSVSLALLIREARYYSLTIFVVSVVVGIYILGKSGKLNSWLAAVILIIFLWLSFFAFSSVYFILLVTIVAAEAISILIKFFQKNSDALRESIPYFVSLVVSFIAVYPFLSYFRTFEISSAMAEFNGYNSVMYWDNVKNVFKYFSQFEALWLFLIIKIVLLLNIKNAFKSYNKLAFASLLTIVLAIIYSFAIGKVPNFIYTRYIIPIQPILVVGFVCDVFLLFKLFSKPETPFSFKNISMILTILVFTIFMLNKNIKNISGHLTEISNQYKGPLDYTIPFIKEKFKNTDTLVIAANYEESSYMYYLKSKVIVGFIGNNLGKDSLENPDIIAYRKPWGNFGSIFQGFAQRAQFIPTGFPIKDNPVNNIPELNFLPAFNHQFKTIMASQDEEATYLYISK